MVGDCVGSSADVFESVAAEIIGAMILGSTLADEAKMGHTHATKFVFFPLVVHAMDILVSSLGIAFVGLTRDAADSDPMKQLQKGYRVALGSSVVGFYVITNWLLEFPENPGSGFKFFLCGIVGIVCAYVIVLSTQYYTDYAYRPVQSIAEASTTGHGTNIIVGVSVGMKATFIPTIAVAIAVLAAYHLGASANIGDGRNSGLFGTAVATMGMLSNAVYILSMNNFGPIADNAGGITEMSMQPEAVREVTDRLDAAGNVTKAVTKGYSIGSASMACFLVCGAFMDEFSEYSGLPFTSVNIATPEVLVGGLIGSMIIFYFTGLAIAAVGRTAHEVVLEVRRQFKENPDIMTYKVKPDYERCVSLVTEAALREMRFPGLVAVLTPIIVGLVFRFIGEATNRPLLGAEVLASYLMFGTVTGILMALFLDTAGGAWDNAKKYIEMGNFGGKNSEAHKASITGDTVGDPFVSLYVAAESWIGTSRAPSTNPSITLVLVCNCRKIQQVHHSTSSSNCYRRRFLLLDHCLLPKSPKKRHRYKIILLLEITLHIIYSFFLVFNYSSVHVPVSLQWMRTIGQFLHSIRSRFNFGNGHVCHPWDGLFQSIWVGF
jgi:H(+)-translocating pyrophosphatase